MFSFPFYDEIRELETILAYNRYLHWVNYEIYSFQWWLLTILSVVMVVGWLKVVDRTRLNEIFLYGLIVAVLSVTLDEFGYEYRLWSYNYHLLAQLPHISWVYYFILPVIYMVVYQYYYTWKAFLPVMLATAGVLAFGCEPLLVWLQIYVPLKWLHIYSLPVYFAIGVAVKAFVIKLNRITCSRLSGGDDE